MKMMEKAHQGGGEEGAEDEEEEEEEVEVEEEEWGMEVVTIMDLMVAGPLDVDVAEDVGEILDLELVEGAMEGDLKMCKMLVDMTTLMLFLWMDFPEAEVVAVDEEEAKVEAGAVVFSREVFSRVESNTTHFM